MENLAALPIAALYTAKTMRVKHHLPTICAETPIDSVLDSIRNKLNTALHSEDATDDAVMYYVSEKWGLYKTIYRPNLTFLEMLSDTEDSPLHIEALRRVPFQCFYLALTQTSGMFVSIEFLQDEALIQVMDCFDAKLEKDYVTGFGYAQRAIWCKSGETIADAFKTAGNLRNDAVYTAEQHRRTLKTAIQFAYYLASENGDIRPVRTKNKGKTPTINGKRHPVSLKQWDVGYRIGDSFEKQIEKSKGTAQETPAKGIQKDRPRPHIRRAHWHHYWSGEGKRNLIAKWLAPILVNGDSSDIVAVRHDVEGEK